MGQPQLGLGLVPLAPQGQHLAAVDPAQALAVGRGGGQLPAPAPGRLGPLAGPAQVGQVPAGKHHRAVDPAGVQGGELAGQDEGHGLVQQGQALLDTAGGDQGPPLELQRDRGQVVVAVGAGRLQRRGGMAGGPLQRSLVQVQLGTGELQPAALDAARIPLHVAEAAAQPADRDRVLAPVEVIVEQAGGGPGRTPVVGGPPVGGVGAVAGGDRLAGAAQPPGRLGQGLQLRSVQAGRVAGG